MNKDEVQTIIDELGNTKNPDEKIQLVKKLKAYCQDERVNNVLIPLLYEDLNPQFLLVVLQTLFHNDDEIIGPLIQLLKQPETPFQIRDEVAKILAETGEKKALKALLK
ncbi:MAG: hypothetical protein GF308_02885, partial [Candidatus Heimdallarchaeota archaeon]|nr:hypothetical protein [Candidatus Heimdallarchaeota archaeon]